MSEQYYSWSYGPDANTEADERERILIYRVGGLRDQIAIAALAGSIAFPIPGNEKIPENAARWAYLYADAMLEARKAKS